MANIKKLEMIDISKSFQGVKANSDINITVREGEILGLLGENGAGKGQTGPLPTLLAVGFGKELENFHGVAEFCHLRTLLFCFLACSFEAIIYLKYSG